MGVSVDELVRKSDPYELGGPLQRAGMAWNGVCGKTVIDGYRIHFAPPASGRNDNQFRSDPQDDEAVLRGEFDGAIRRAAATAILALGAHHGVKSTYVNQYLDAVHVTTRKLSERLKAMGARGGVMRGWAEDLRAEHAAVEASLAGSCFYELDENGERESDDEYVVLRVGVHVDFTGAVAFCARADVAEPDEKDEELFLLESVVGYIAGRGSAPPEEPEAYEAPAPPPPPVSPPKRTRAQRDAAELLETQRSWRRSGGRTQSKAARRDRATWEAEAKDDVEDDDEYFVWEPPGLEFGEDPRATNKVRRYGLLDEALVNLTASESFECMPARLLPKGVPRSHGRDIRRIGRVSYDLVVAVPAADADLAARFADLRRKHQWTPPAHLVRMLKGEVQLLGGQYAPRTADRLTIRFVTGFYVAPALRALFEDGRLLYDFPPDPAPGPAPADAYDLAPLRACLRRAVDAAAVNSVRRRGYAVVDRALPLHFCRAARKELEALRARDLMIRNRSYSVAVAGDGAADAPATNRARLAAAAARKADDVDGATLKKGIWEAEPHQPGVAAAAPTLCRLRDDGTLAACLAPLLPEVAGQTLRLQVNDGRGGAFAYHCDTAANLDDRQLTVLCYLNEGWRPDDGGALRLVPYPRDEVSIEPVAGRLVVFDARNMVHATTAATRPRYCFTLWLSGPRPAFALPGYDAAQLRDALDFRPQACKLRHADAFAAALRAAHESGGADVVRDHEDAVASIRASVDLGLRGLRGRRPDARPEAQRLRGLRRVGARLAARVLPGRRGAEGVVKGVVKALNLPLHVEANKKLSPT